MGILGPRGRQRRRDVPKREEEIYNLEEGEKVYTNGVYQDLSTHDGQLDTKKGGNRKTLRDVVKTFDKDNEGTVNRSQTTEIEERESGRGEAITRIQTEKREPACTKRLRRKEHKTEITESTDRKVES